LAQDNARRSSDCNAFKASQKTANAREWMEVLTDGDKLGCHLLLLPPCAQIDMQDAAHLSDNAVTAVFQVENGGLSAENHT
jgi:hypothetical protein